jgi:hypothetical protein
MRVTMFLGLNRDQAAYKESLSNIAETLEGICPIDDIETR